MPESSFDRGVGSSTPRESVGLRLARLGRLTRKELRETLRDRRTIVTLVLMPLLLYPLLSVGFRQLFFSANVQSRPLYRVFVRDKETAEWIFHYLELTEEKETYEEAALKIVNAKDDRPRVWLYSIENPQQAVLSYLADVAIEVKSPLPTALPDPTQDLALDINLLYRTDSPAGARAAAFLESQLTAANERFLSQRLALLGQKQRAAPLRSERVVLGDVAQSSGGVLLTLTPLILILMTITGAVYPAIDLTAGERERGTLEILVAAPVPRLGLLLAKYVSVLTVALLTALVNLIAMSATVVIGGLGPALFGDSGVPLRVILEILGLLLLFATFFSAILLTLTSFARTFKEAQAYLIPLMMVAIAPGLLTFMPQVELTGTLTIAPLVNIVLLARDLLAQQSSAGTAAIVVISTLLYSLAAIGIAARFFAAEAVLYTSESGWSDLFQRPRGERAVPNPANAMFCAAMIFSAFFVALNVVNHASSLRAQLALSGLATVGVFAGLPCLAAVLRRINLSSAFRCRVGNYRRLLLVLPGAILIGVGIWAWSHELLVLQMQLGLISVSEQQRATVMDWIARCRELHFVWLLLPFGLAPAVGEELFFRGYLFSAIRGKAGPWTTILTTALLFGLFHVVTPGGISLVRLGPSTLAGVFLGWVAWRTGSVWPSMVLHGCHNSLLMAAAYYQPALAAAGYGVEEASHLPLAWFSMATLCALTGFAWVTVTTRGSQSERQ